MTLTTSRKTIAQAISQLMPPAWQSQVISAIEMKLPPEDSKLVQRAIYEALIIPSHSAILVYVDSPLGRLWQSHTIVKDTGRRIERNYPNLSETIERREEPLDAAVRGIQEELGLEIAATRLTLIEANRLELKYSKRDGHMKRYLFQVYKLALSQEEAETAQLQADEGDTVVYFEWR